MINNGGLRPPQHSPGSDPPVPRAVETALTKCHPQTFSHRSTIISVNKVLETLELCARNNTELSPEREENIWLENVAELASLITRDKRTKPSAKEIESRKWKFEDSQAPSGSDEKNSLILEKVTTSVNGDACNLINKSLHMIVANAPFNASKDHRIVMLVCNLIGLTLSNGSGEDKSKAGAGVEASDLASAAADPFSALGMNGLPRRAMQAMRVKVRDVKWQLTILRYLHLLVSSCGDSLLPPTSPSSTSTSPSPSPRAGVEGGLTIKTHLVHLGLIERLLFTVQHHHFSIPLISTSFDIIYLCVFEVEDELQSSEKSEFFLRGLFDVVAKGILRHRRQKQVVAPCASLLYAFSLNLHTSSILTGYLSMEHFSVFFEIFPFDDDIFVDVVGLLNQMLLACEEDVTRKRKLLPDLMSVDQVIEKIEAIVVMVEVDSSVDDGEEELLSHAIPVLEMLRARQRELSDDLVNHLHDDHDHDEDDGDGDDSHNENEISQSSQTSQQQQQFVQQLQAQKKIKKHTHKKQTQTMTSAHDIDILTNRIQFLQKSLNICESKLSLATERMLMAQEEVASVNVLRFEAKRAASQRRRERRERTQNPFHHHQHHHHHHQNGDEKKQFDGGNHLIYDDSSNDDVSAAVDNEGENDDSLNINNNKEFAYEIAKKFLNTEAQDAEADQHFLVEFANAIETTFLYLLLTTNASTMSIFGVLPNSFCRKFFTEDLKLCCLAEADLQIARVGKLSRKASRTGIDFESFCKVLFTLYLVKASSSKDKTRTTLLKHMTRRLTKISQSGGGMEEAIISKAEHDLMSPIKTRKEASIRIRSLERPGWHSTVFHILKSSNTRLQLKQIFVHYATTSAKLQSPLSNKVKFVCFPQIMNFLRDFCLIPELTTGSFALSIFTNLLQKNGSDLKAGHKFVNDVNIGITFEIFLEFVGLIADSVNWSRSSAMRDMYNVDLGGEKAAGAEGAVTDEDDQLNKNTESKIVAFLQWMDTSNGKGKICRARGIRMIGKFPLDDALYSKTLTNLTQPPAKH